MSSITVHRSSDTQPTEFEPVYPHGGWRYGVDLGMHLVAREFRSRYRRSLFGSLWSVFQPLLRFLVLGVVFGQMLTTSVDHFASFLFSGLVFWQWFAGGVGSSTRSVLQRADLLSRPGLPRWMIPITSIFSDALDLLTALPVLLVVLRIDGRPLTGWIAVLPLTLLIQFALIAGVGMLFCTGNVYLRDIGFLVDISLLLGFYVTPVFYDIADVPQRWRWIVDWNPMTQLLSAQRSILLNGQAPDWPSLLKVGAVSLVVLAVGALVFTRADGNFLDEV